MRLNVDFSQKDEKKGDPKSVIGFRKRAEHTELLMSLIDFAGDHGFIIQSSEIILDGSDFDPDVKG
jgi:mannitol/fructose-specific phosphotransferase system IIA component (Ntr-type)